MIEVEVENRSGVEVDVAGAVDLARHALAVEGVDEAELGIAFVTPDEIRALKAEHLGIDEADRRALVPDRRPRRAAGRACRGRSATS